MTYDTICSFSSQIATLFRSLFPLIFNYFFQVFSHDVCFKGEGTFRQQYFVVENIASDKHLLISRQIKRRIYTYRTRVSCSTCKATYSRVGFIVQQFRFVICNRRWKFIVFWDRIVVSRRQRHCVLSFAHARKKKLKEKFDNYRTDDRVRQSRFCIPCLCYSLCPPARRRVVSYFGIWKGRRIRWYLLSCRCYYGTGPK